jgi:hypothetical protein
VQLIQEIGQIITALEQVGTELKNLSGSLGMTASEVSDFAQNLASNLLSYLLISYLERTQAGVVGVANLLGVIDYIPNPGVSGDPTHPPFTTRKLQLSRLGDLFTKPDQLLKSVYQWGAPGFDGAVLIPRLGNHVATFWRLFRNTVCRPSSLARFFAVFYQSQFSHQSTWSYRHAENRFARGLRPYASHLRRVVRAHCDKRKSERGTKGDNRPSRKRHFPSLCRAECAAGK